MVRRGSPVRVRKRASQAYRRLTPAEQDERDLVLEASLRRADERLERCQALHAEGHEVAAVGLLRYVDLLLARFNLAPGRAKAGDAGWEELVDDADRDADIEAWVAAQVVAAK